MAIQATTGGRIVSEVYVNGIRYVPVRDVSIETMPFDTLSQVKSYVCTGFVDFPTFCKRRRIVPTWFQVYK